MILHMMYFPWIFNSYSSSKVKSLLQFRDEIVVTELYQYWYQQRGTYDAAHVRRGDIVLKGFTGSHSCHLVTIILSCYDPKWE